MITVLVILGLTIVLFVSAKWTPDVVALLSLMALFLTGVLTLEETLSGFSNPTVVMIAALFIVGEGLSRTGWTSLAAQYLLQWAGSSVPRLLVIVLSGAGLLSGFVSNTGTVAALMPATVSAAWSAGTLPSKLLLPVAFGSNTGGLLTLTGTPPNIIVSNALIESGQTGFSFFEFGLIGLPLILVSIVYFRFIGFRLLPSRKTENKPVNIDGAFQHWLKDYSISESIYRFRIRSMSPLIDTKIGDWDLEDNHHVSITRIKRRHPSFRKRRAPFVELPDKETELRYHDIITVHGQPNDIEAFMQQFSLGLLPSPQAADSLRDELINQEVGLAEILISPKSILVGQKVNPGTLLKRYDIQLLAASRKNEPLRGKVSIEPGDMFLVRGTWGNMDAMKNYYKNVVLLGSPEELSKNVTTLNAKSWIALGCLLLLVLLLVLDIMPAAIASIFCAGILVLSKCVPVAKAYKAISWSSVIMIAAMIPMSVALNKTGVTQMTATAFVNVLGEMHPSLLLAGLFLVTSAFSQTISNSATAVLMAPVAILAASQLGISAKPLLIIVAISASTSFLTPVGTTTNAMVMAAGGYRFLDYMKVGAPLLLLFFALSVLMVPLIWGF